MNSKLKNIPIICSNINLNLIQIQKYQDENKKLSELLKELSSDEDVKKIIINHFHFEDNGQPRTLTSEIKSSSSDGESKITLHEYPNPNASFNPELDDFDIKDYEYSHSGKKIRFKIDCIRRHKLINAFMWEPDYYWTDWINLDEYGE